MYLPLLLSLIILGFFIYIFFLKRYEYWKRRNVPFSTPVFFLGNVGQVLTLRETYSNMCKTLHCNFRGCRYVGFFNMWTPAILVRDPEIIKNVLVKDYESFRNWIALEEGIDPIFFRNPFVLYGSKWKSIRSVLSPQFTNVKMKRVVPNVQVVAEKMISYIKNEMKTSGCIDALQLASRYTGGTVMSGGFGLDGKPFEKDPPDFFKVFENSGSKATLLKQTAAISFSQLRKIFKITLLGDPVSRIFKDIIINSLKYRNQSGVAWDNYLGFLNKMKEKSLPNFSSDDELVSHAFTFFVDGFDTAGLVLAYAFFELSENENIQTNAREEINRILDKYDNVLSYEALQDMEYIECVIFEILRKYPIQKVLGRVCMEDVVFPSPYTNDENQEVIIKKGTEVFISWEGIHHDGDYYPNPEIFNPDRFKKENKASIPKYSYFGFGEGPKNCLGRPFALIQLKVALVSILNEFNLTLNPHTIVPLHLEYNHMRMVPSLPIWINFDSRY